MSQMSEAKQLALTAIDNENDKFREISLDLWNHPELAFEEVYAHDLLTNYLEQKGFEVEREYKLKTAFRAVTESKKNSNGVTIGVMCEYDALPGIGHACGHNLIAIFGLSVAVGIKHALDKGGIEGKLIVLGCPAEEGGGGKIDLINAGAYKDMDCAMMAHPSQYSLPKPIYVGMAPITITYKGKASHAGSFPWDGVNALDAAVLCYQNISCMRHHFRPTWRVHGIFTKAGEKPNIIPETAQLEYYCRAPNIAEMEELKEKIKSCVEGAAIATGCNVEYHFGEKAYLPLNSNDTMANLYVDNGEKIGIQFEKDYKKLTKQGGSTDMGNVSMVLPSLHPKYTINTEVAAHTREFAQQTKTEEAHDSTINHSKAMALAAIDIFSDPSIIVKIKSEL